MTPLPETIKAVQLQEDRTVAVVAIPFSSEDKIKNLPEDQILIRTRAVGLNPSDWKHALTEWGTPGAISGCDAAGDVVAVGTAVSHIKVGDRVAAYSDGGARQKDNGAFAEYTRFVAAACFVLPRDMTYEEGASFPIPHYTAAYALYFRLGLPKPFTPEAAEFKKKGDKILVWGGSTAVGHHAIQLAALSGLEVYATASPSAHNEVKALGASHVFDYRDPKVVTKILAAAGEKGVIYALDAVSEKGSTDATIDAISHARGGAITTVLPVSDETQQRREDVKVDFIVMGMVLGIELVVAHIHLPAVPEDKVRIYEYCTQVMPRLLDGWKAGVGSSHFRTQRLREIPGGLEGIAQGMRIMQDGAYGREKLVCRIA
ncbi:GroES-like protein [Peniophora sp. CONT]|nr:GroES-like protein [Peniophora sp. CONT]